MKLSELRKLVKEVLQEFELEEANTTNVGGASFTPGDGAQYATDCLPGRGFGTVGNLSIYCPTAAIEHLPPLDCASFGWNG